MYRYASHLWRSFSHNRTKINIQFLNDTTSFMRFGFMKRVSPCDRAKNVLQETFKSLTVFTIEHCSILATCFVRLFPISQSNSRLFQFNGGKPFFIFSEHVVTIFTYYILVFNIILASNAKDISINIINDFKTKKLKELYECERNCLLCLLVNGTWRSFGIPFSSTLV